jgi:Tfp pilus assembly protein PilX
MYLAMRFYERGQALLIVILVMTVALTVGLSVATRTINTVRTTVEEENSQRAFSAAEAGLERSLQSGTASTGEFGNNTTYQATVATLAGQEFILNNGASVLKDDAVDLWLSTYPTYTGQWTGDVTLFWGSGAASTTCNPNEAVNISPALEIVLIHGTRTSPILTRYAVDPCTARRGGNSFQAPAGGGGTVQEKLSHIDSQFLLHRE